MICFKGGGKSEKGGISFVKLFESRMIATFDKRRESFSTIALTK